MGGFTVNGRPGIIAPVAKPRRIWVSELFQVLIVEDNEDTQELLLAQLEQPDYNIRTASNGQEAILTVGQEPPDVVIMDIMMPTLDGLETSRYFKLRFREGPSPILVLSAKSDFDSREQAGEYGCEDYIAKPHDRKQLVDSVAQLIELGRLERKLRAGDGDQGAEERVVEIRLGLAERQVDQKSATIAKKHAQRVLELRPGHARAEALLARVAQGA